jgi:Prolyl 4-Hydroxylase alpha-subunit, N-terminal region
VAIDRLSELLLICISFRVVKSELYTSLAAMEELLVSEQVLIDNLASYIEREEKKLNELKGILDFYNKNHKAASANIGKFLENPIRAFQMIKRVTSDWVEVEKLVTYDNMMGISRLNFHDSTL